MKDLRIKLVENGFLVTAHKSGSGLEHPVWVFEDSLALAEFVKDWAAQTKAKKDRESDE